MHVIDMPWEAFQAKFHAPPVAPLPAGAYTNETDLSVLAGLITALGYRRLLEVGTARGLTTAHLAAFTPEDAVVYTIGTLADMDVPVPEYQRGEVPRRTEFAAQSNLLGKAYKIFFVTADSAAYDFRRFGELDFAFIDGAHDYRHVLGDTQKAYAQIRRGGVLVWHDFARDEGGGGMDVRRAVAAFDPPGGGWACHVLGTQVGFHVVGGPPGL